MPTVPGPLVSRATVQFPVKLFWIGCNSYCRHPILLRQFLWLNNTKVFVKMRLNCFFAFTEFTEILCLKWKQKIDVTNANWGVTLRNHWCPGKYSNFHLPESGPRWTLRIRFQKHMFARPNFFPFNLNSPIRFSLLEIYVAQKPHYIIINFEFLNTFKNILKLIQLLLK